MKCFKCKKLLEQSSTEICSTSSCKVARVANEFFGAAFPALLPASSKNVNVCSSLWMTSVATSKLKELLNKWDFGCLFDIFYGNSTVCL